MILVIMKYNLIKSSGKEKFDNFVNKAKETLYAGAGLLAVGAVLAAVSSPFWAQHASRHGYNATVTDKQIKRYGSAEHSHDKYMIFTKLDDGDVKVFENTDSMFEWKFNSSDVQGKLENGHRYHIEAYGWRFPFVSWYENIVDVQELPKQKTEKE